MKKTTLFCLELVLMPFVTFASCIFFYALILVITLDLNLALIASLILGGLSFFPFLRFTSAMRLAKFGRGVVSLAGFLML